MIQGWQIVAEVYTAYRGLPVKLAGMNGKTDEWYQSHGRQPKSQNPDASGNLSETEHFMRQCRKFEGGMRGAGQMLINRVHTALTEEFAERIAQEVSHGEMSTEILREGCDVHIWLSNFKIETATRAELLDFERECSEAIDALLNAKSQARVRIKHIEMERHSASARQA